MWVKGNVSIEAPALILKKHLSSFNGSLKEQQFAFKKIMAVNPEKFFIDKDKISFYKLNKSKKKGDPLYLHDLTPIRLVSSGHPVKITFDQNGIKLSGKAIPMQNGRLGESIQLKNANTKKVIVGEVIGLNTVAVQL